VAVGRVVILLALAATACGRPSARAIVPAPTGETSGPSAAVTSVDLPAQGTGIALTPDGRRALVATVGGVLVVDVDAGRVAEKIDAGDAPCAIAVAPDGRHAWVADLLSRNLTELDLRTDAATARISLGGPRRPVLTPSVAVSGDGARVYAIDGAKENLLVVDAADQRVLHDQFLDIHPGGVAASRDGRLVYVAGCRLSCVDGEVLIVEAASAAVTKRVRLPSAPSGLALSRDGRYAYVPHGREATVSVIDLAGGSIATLAVDPHPVDVAVGRDGLLYVPSFASASLVVVDPATRQRVARVALRNPAHGVAVSDDGRVYVTHAAKTLSIIDMRHTHKEVS